MAYLYQETPLVNNYQDFPMIPTMNSSYFSIEDPATFDIEEEKRLEETAAATNKKHKCPVCGRHYVFIFTHLDKRHVNSIKIIDRFEQMVSEFEEIVDTITTMDRLIQNRQNVIPDFFFLKYKFLREKLAQIGNA